MKHTASLKNTTDNPLISIIIVNFNGLNWLSGCLSSVFKQKYTNFEVIFVDNGSSDKSVNFVKSKFPKTKIIVNNDNLGFAQGNNVGYKKCSGKYILLLNTDTSIPPDFLIKLKNGLEEHNAGIIQPKLVLMKDKKTLDTCGSFWTDTTFLYHYGYGKKHLNKKYSKAYQVFSVKGAAMLIKREVIQKTKLFDDRFWNYYEETDFCHRAWIAGFTSWYFPNVICFHGLGGTSLEYFNKSYIQFHNFKNKLCSFIKNFESKNVVLNVSKFVLLNFVIACAWILQGKVASTISLFKAIWWNIINLKATLKKRKQIQKTRVLSDNYISGITKTNPNLGYYKLLFADKVSDYED